MRGIDRALIVTLAPLWALVLLLSFLSMDRNEVVSPIRVQGAASPSDAPVVTSLPAWSIPAESGPSVRVGDSLVSVGGVDVAGAGAATVIALAWIGMDESGVLPLVVERDGQRIDAVGRIPATIPKWPPLLMSLVYGSLAIFAIVRFPTLRVSQLAFPAFMTAAIWMGSLFGRTPPEVLASFFLRASALLFLWPLNVRLVRHMPDGRDGAPWAAGWPWLLGGLGILLVDSTIWGVLPPRALDLAEKFLTLGAALLVLGIGARNYRRANRTGRQRFKWLLLGVVVGTTPGATVAFFSAVRPELGQYFLQSQLAQIAIPICLLIAITRHRLFDIDRLLNGAVVVVGATLVLCGFGAAVGPALQTRLVETTGATPQTVGLGLLVVALAIVAPIGFFVRRRLDAWVLRERLRRERAVEALLGEISAVSKLSELSELLRVRLPEVWNARGAAVHLGIEGRMRCVADGLDPALDHAIDARVGTLLEGRGAVAGNEVDLPELAGSLLASLARGSRPIEGVLILGPERSGEPYDERDRALLTLVAERSAAAISGLEGRALLAEAREMGRRLESERVRAEQDSEAKSRMLAAASHDARQPLQAMRLFLGTLASRLDDAELQDLVQNAQLSATAMQQQFEALLDQTRLDSGAFAVRVGVVDLAELFAELAAFLGPLADAKELELHFESNGLAVRSDAALLRSILQNLVGNAIRYTRAGSVNVRARRAEGGVELTVADTGVGMTAQVAERVFEPWERGDEARSDGAGLGLSIVSRLAELLGHPLEVRSEPGMGATFSFRLEEAAIVRDSADMEREAAPGGSAHVFVIDDDRPTREALAGLLERFGATVHSAEDAATLLASQQRKPDAVLLDFSLAEGSGLDALDELQARYGRIPAAILSGEEGPRASDAAQARGLPFLRKPAAPVQIRALLESLLASGR